MAAFTTSIVGAPVACKPAVRTRAAARTVAVASVNGKQALGSLLALSAAVLLNVAPAHADLTSDLLAKSQANKTLHDKQRLATSGANFARSRTVTDGTCQFPNNWVGCQNSAEQGEVKFLSDDLALECEGVESGKICPAKAAGSFPSPFGL